MTDPTWPQLLAAEPRLGDLLAEVRASPGSPGDRDFWKPDGFQDELIRICAQRWPANVNARIAAYDLALDILWNGLRPHKEEEAPMNDLVQRRADVDRRLLAHSGAFWRMAQAGGPDAEYFELVARFAADLTIASDDTIHAIIATLEAAQDAQRGSDDAPQGDSSHADERK